MDIVQRIMDRVKVNPDTGCWEWQGGTVKGGYGQLKVNRRTRQVHRLMYEAVKSAIPQGLQCCHHCDNPPCCNPEHLFIGTTLDNQRDSANKGRKATGDNHGTHTHPELYRGERNRNAKLTNELVSRIRAEYDRQVEAGVLSFVKLSSMFGIHCTTAKRVARRQSWRHVP